MQREKVRSIVFLGVLSAIAYVVMVIGRIPIGFVDFLKYDPKDVVIALGGFIVGPAAVLGVSLTVSFIEMFTVSTTGIIGFIMNILSTCAFAFPAAFIYKRKRSMGGAIAGLTIGTAIMATVMLLWNYLITPLYIPNASREMIAGMLLPAFLPFNLIKGGLNASLTFLLYKPIVTGLRSAKIAPAASLSEGGKPRTISRWGILFAGFVLLSCVLLVLSARGLI